jgi:hypothetical protein
LALLLRATRFGMAVITQCPRDLKAIGPPLSPPRYGRR